MKKAIVAVLGGLLTVAGIALLILPGPGFVLIAAGLAVLATQFAWANKPLNYAKGKAQQGIDEVGKSWWRTGFAAACALALLAVGVVEFVVDLPVVTGISAAMLLLSGVALIGTLVYARRTRHAEPDSQPADGGRNTRGGSSPLASTPDDQAQSVTTRRR